MNTFWLKMAGFAVVVVVLIVLINVFTGPMPVEQAQDDEQTAQQEQTEESAGESQRESLEDRSARRALERQQRSVPNRINAMRQREVVEQRQREEVRQQVQEMAVEDEVQAERLYQMAVTSSKIARKPMMTYKKMVDYCRQIIQSYPNSIQAEKSRQLLREMPRRDRKMYKVTNEEMGIGE